ncbi:carbohydrate ABC transporter permease [Thermoanaerobacter sp. YS13]|uniref:carbohydrate ABC transporter permease n=1 Tax=Thermoanaerobacter sp. YS13 TaxID=1511746 RepID=UPI000B247079|nr:carbohydrate ABC transporter permease [Thermoanaerobacter sp. YS13]
MYRKSKDKYFIIMLLLIGSIGMLLPFFWMVSTSFKPANEIFNIPPTFIPKKLTIQNYVQLFREMNFGIYLKNTLIIALFSMLGLVINALAGYAFAKFQFPGKEKIFYLVLATMMIPGQVTMIPVYLMLNKMGLTNTMPGIILPGLASAFGIFLFRQFMATIPSELIEAARIDGASEFRIFLQIILPESKPVFAVQGTFTFIGAWNSFLWPLIVANDENLYTLSVGLALLKGQHGSDFGLQMAGSTFLVIPIIIVFLFLQRYFVEGITITGIK